MKTIMSIVILCILILTSTIAIASDDNSSNETDALNDSSNLSFSSINLSGEIINILDHTSDPSEGNWITLGSPSEIRRIQLPQPIMVTYSGPRSLRHGEVSGTLSSSNNNTDNNIYAINYPTNLSYTTLPIYLPGENVSISFFGTSALKGNVNVYVFSITSKSISGVLNALRTGDAENLSSNISKNINGTYSNYSTALGEDGDFSNYDLGAFDPGQYFVLLAQNNEDGSRTVLSATAFVVAEHDLNVSAPASTEVGNNLDINLAFNDISSNISSNYTYGAVLINEQAYKANIDITSNGTKNGTSVLINGVKFIDQVDTNISNYKSKLNKNELQKEIQTLIGEGNGTLAVGEVGQEELSLTTFDLPEGHYYLFAGAYDPKGKIAGLTQQDFEITSSPTSQPVANFSSNVIIGFTPLSVQFNDSSENATGWYWDFGDGNTSTEENPMHTYSSANNYLVNLTVSNNNGISSKLSTIFVLQRPPEPLNIVAIEESPYAYVLSGIPISFDFSSGLTPILGISFTTSQTLGETMVTVYQLNSQSSLISGLPSGIVYEYFDIWINNAASNVSDNFSNATISFKVSKEWRKHLNIIPSSIVLNRYHNGVWSPLPTTLVRQDADYMYFIAQTPGFSPFAITGTPAGNKINNGNVSYSIFKSVIGVDETGDCILNAPKDVLQYRIVVKNEGNVSLTNVSVNDSLINLTGPVGNGTAENVLYPGETWDYTGNYSVTAGDVNNGTGYVNNTATVTCDQLPENSSSVNMPVAKNADLSIYKSVTGIDESGDHILNAVGDIIQYQVAVKNNGDVDLTEVSVIDPLVTLTKSRGDLNDPEVLNPGETWVYAGNYSVTLQDMNRAKSGDGIIVNTATVSCDQLSNESSSLDLPIIYIPPILDSPETDSSTVLPLASFNTNVTSGYAPLAVQFNDNSQNATTWSWDFNNDGTADSNEQNPVNTYAMSGTYTVKLTVSNSKGSSSDTETISVLEKSSSTSGGSSSGGSGGMGGSISGRNSGSSNGSSNEGNSTNSGSVSSTDSSNNAASGQKPSVIAPQKDNRTKAGTNSTTLGDNNGGILKIGSFLIGLLAVLLAGVLILKKMGPKKEK